MTLFVTHNAANNRTQKAGRGGAFCGPG